MITNPSEAPVQRSQLINDIRAAATGDNTVSYTGVGFMPTTVIIQAVALSSSILCTSMGYCDDDRTRYCFYKYNSGQNYLFQNDELIRIGEEANRNRAILNSFDVDGFTLGWVKTGTPAWDIRFSALCFR